MIKKILLFALAVLPLLSYAQIISTICGTGTAGYNGDGISATGAEINNPSCIVTDNSGNVYFSDFANNRVRKISSTGIITTFAGTGTPGNTGDGGSATAAELYRPIGLAFDDSGNLFISTSSYVIKKINTAGIISTVAGTGVPGNSGDGGPATLAKMNGTIALAFDDTGNLYFVDWASSVVRKISITGIITTIAGNGTVGNTGDGGMATAAELYNPIGLAIDDSNNLYISCRYGDVRKVSTEGIISTFAGGGRTILPNGIPATEAELGYLGQIAFDKLGNLYLVEQTRSEVYTISKEGIINTYAGTGASGFSGDGGPAKSAELTSPYGIGLDGNGDLFITDGERIREVTGYLAVSAVNKPVFNIFPNPANDQLSVTCSTKIEKISITNVLGQEVFTGNYDDNNVVIDTRSMQPGVYFVKVNNSIVKEIIKQ